MTDPAIEAAQRAWAAQFPLGPSWSAIANDSNQDFFASSAREALKPIREKHVPVEYYEYDDTNGVFKTDADGERILMGRVCRECSTDEFLEILGDCEIEDSTRYEGEVAWPCETAKLIYTTEELAQ